MQLRELTIGSTVCLTDKICGVITKLEQVKKYDATSSYPGAIPSVLGSYYDYVATLRYERDGVITDITITEDDITRKKYTITEDAHTMYRDMPAGWGGRIKNKNKRTHRKKGKSRRKRMTRSR